MLSGSVKYGTWKPYCRACLCHYTSTYIFQSVISSMEIIMSWFDCSWVLCNTHLWFWWLSMLMQNSALGFKDRDKSCIYYIDINLISRNNFLYIVELVFNGIFLSHFLIFKLRLLFYFIIRVLCLSFICRFKVKLHP